ncbi:hypothetical protein LWP59_15780 [Amycolatopsis acidiphila]|uniref:Uncharacterized protein n=1 Tax=Amycolatopsis acidiphila TaxID=715473 RepID=A0A558A9I7_9PSEU|nr:hypothetical protein [Amycolatopsis acidiphila]TVT20923.1 hypothetical protein FNH06_18945 [Amycolatopsis acidiphila]UIJ62977.1 hypothetical protein LWP59_15780 [Amycolatopsis acidiphila]GHG65407.1 hypothetical protein GCM10017788_22870 [Amycolatopsis acidiphila]
MTVGMSMMGLSGGALGLIALVGLIGLLGLRGLRTPRATGDPLERYPEANQRPVPFADRRSSPAASWSRPGFEDDLMPGGGLGDVPPAPRSGVDFPGAPVPGSSGVGGAPAAPVAASSGVGVPSAGFEAQQLPASSRVGGAPVPASAEVEAQPRMAGPAYTGMAAPSNMEGSQAGVEHSWFGTSAPQEGAVGLAQESRVDLTREAPLYGVPAARQQPLAERLPTGTPPREGVFAGEFMPVRPGESPSSPGPATAPWSAEESWEREQAARRATEDPPTTPFAAPMAAGAQADAAADAGQASVEPSAAPMAAGTGQASGDAARMDASWEPSVAEAPPAAQPEEPPRRGPRHALVEPDDDEFAEQVPSTGEPQWPAGGLAPAAGQQAESGTGQHHAARESAAPWSEPAGQAEVPEVAEPPAAQQETAASSGRGWEQRIPLPQAEPRQAQPQRAEYQQPQPEPQPQQTPAPTAAPQAQHLATPPAERAFESPQSSRVRHHRGRDGALGHRLGPVDRLRMWFGRRKAGSN